MRKIFLVFAILAICSPAVAKKSDHEWLTGKILNENQARYFAGMLHNSSSQTNESGSWDGNANTSSYGNITNTNANGTYSGTTTTSTSGSSIPLYRVYDNLMIDGGEEVYITSERLRWRWSKSAHVAINGTVKYYVDHHKMHVLDDDGKEHTVEIIRTIKKEPTAQTVPTIAATQVAGSTLTSPSAQSVGSTIPIAIESAPPGADIEIDDAFVGNTPSTVNVAPGTHKIAVKKKGFTDWVKTVNVTGGSIHLSPTLDQAPAQ